MDARRLKANLLLLLTAAIWGLAFVAQRVGAEHLSAYAFNGARFALGAVSLLPLVVLFDRRARTTAGAAGSAGDGGAIDAADAAPPRSWRSALVPGLAAGLMLFLGSTLQQLGLETTTAGKAGFITGLYIVVVPVLGMALGHRTGRNTWLGGLLALAGLYLLSVTDAMTISPGDGLCLIGTLFWASHILVIDRFAGRIDPLRLSVVQFAACSVVSLVIALVVDGPAGFEGLGAAWTAVFYGGFFSVGVAYTLQVFAQRDALASHAAIILSMESLFGAIGGAWLLGERMTGRGYLGCALMLAGVLLSQIGGAEDADRRGEPDEEAPLPVPEPPVA